MPSPLRVSTPSGSWVSGNEAPRGLPSPCETRGSSRISGGPSRTSRREDNVGSPYCVRRYVVDEHLGGPKGSPPRGAISVNAGCA